MQIINRFNIEIKISTFNAGDMLEWVPFAQHTCPPNSRIEVRAHDNGWCKIRIDWSNFGGRELGVHSDGEVLLLVPPPQRPKSEMLDDPVTGGPDELTNFLREHQEEVRLHYLHLPWHRPDQPPQSPP